jgi:hypothetical protein
MGRFVRRELFAGDRHGEMRRRDGGESLLNLGTARLDGCAMRCEGGSDRVTRANGAG